MKFTINLFRALSVLSLIYFFLIMWVSGLKTSFLGFWLALSISSLGMSFLLTLMNSKTDSPYPLLRNTLLGTIWFCILVFTIVEGIIIYESYKAPQKHADYVIVLGAQVRGTIPSRALHSRILTAANYLQENPNSIAICSGGQGDGEQITEAKAIQEGLIANGISTDRILLEEASTNTVQNLINSKEMITDPSAFIVIVTSDFHILRAKKIAEHIGYQNLSMCPADEFMVTTFSYYVREFFALFKDLVVGNL